MKTNGLKVILAVAWAAAACRGGGQQVPRADGAMRIELPRPVRDTPPLAASGERSDTAYVVTDGQSRFLVWESPVGTRIWKSDDIFGGEPHYRLQDLNDDGRPDLFWSVSYEELIRTSLVLRDVQGATLLRPNIGECREGSLKREQTGYALVVYSAAGYPQGDCEDPILRKCAERFQMDWPREFRIEGGRLVETAASAGEYRSLAERYRRSAEALDSLLAAKATFPGASVGFGVCGRSTPKRLLELSDSATALSR